jgi:hypothetical protein
VSIENLGKKLVEAVVGIVLAFPVGVWVGYIWRDRISRQRRAQYWVDRFYREQRIERERAAAARAARDLDAAEAAVPDG